MCNKLHGKVKKLKRTGIGYKIFSIHFVDDKIELSPMFAPPGTPRYSIQMKNKWNRKYNSYDDGFCFFSTKRQAIWYKYDNSWYNSPARKIYKIQYSKGLGKISHKQGSVGKLTFSLCKEFKILGEV
jgi:hypothetical protein